MFNYFNAWQLKVKQNIPTLREQGACFPEEWNDNNNMFPEYSSIVTWRQREFDNET